MISIWYIPAKRLFLNIKNNLGLETLGLAYRIAPPSDGEGLQAHVGTPRIEWEDEPLKIRADDIMVGQPDTDPATAPAAAPVPGLRGAPAPDDPTSPGRGVPGTGLVGATVPAG